MPDILSSNQQELVELVEPMETALPPEVLNPGHIVTSPDGKSFPIIDIVRTEFQTNIYETLADGQANKVWLYEVHSTTEVAERLRREGQVLKDLNSPMFPCFIAYFESDSKTYFVREALPSQVTFADMFAERLSLTQILPVLAQTASGLSHLHEKGWVHAALCPNHIFIGKPIKIIGLSHAIPIGKKPPLPFSYAGYSPTDLNTEEPVDPRIDIYALGALFYHAVTGQKISETGAELNMLPALAGVKQVLYQCLGSRDARYSTMVALHRDLLRLRQRIEPKVSYSLAGASSIGLDPTRATNQDAYGYLTGHCSFETGTHTWAVICLADGMGGMEAGEVASQTAIGSILMQVGATLPQINQLKGDVQTRLVKRWTSVANEAVYSALEERGEHGGCTLVCACILERRLAIAHVGDSRLYLLRDGRIELLTRDHSLSMTLVMQGEIKLEEVRHHPDRNKLLRSLGERQPLPEYFIDGLDKVMGENTVELFSGDILILCSDGLWEAIAETNICQLIQHSSLNLHDTANALIEASLKQSSNSLDNVTVVLVRLDETIIPLEDRKG